MKKVLTALQMKEYDRNTIDYVGIPSMVLMERAALSVYDEILHYSLDTNLKPSKTKVLVVCGTGNNGADGLAIARLLYQNSFQTRVVLIGDKQKCSIENQQQSHILKKLGLSVETKIEELEYDIVVDALFGIGLHRTIDDFFYHTIELMNGLNGYKISVDIPSGINTDNGKVHGIAFKADLTVTFEYLKRGLFLGMGPLYSGKICLKPIGIKDIDFETDETLLYFDENVNELLPYRNPIGNKGTFGKIYIYAGSESTIGAALLCAKSAFSSGAGMVKVLCPKKYEEFFLEQLPEAMLTCYENEYSVYDISDKIKKDIQWADSIVAGPGIGVSETSKHILQIFVKYAKVPMVLDADALNLISINRDLEEELLIYNKKFKRTIIMTPHIGELIRLLNVSCEELKEDIYKYAVMLSENYDCIAVCKDAKTIVKKKDSAGYLNLSGNHGMATAGSGDVLAGILGAYVAIADDIYLNVKKGVYLHGCAGDLAARMNGERSMISSNIIEGIMQLQKGY